MQVKTALALFPEKEIVKLFAKKQRFIAHNN
jgi:hypothetical protein